MKYIVSVFHFACAVCLLAASLRQFDERHFWWAGMFLACGAAAFVNAIESRQPDKPKASLQGEP